MSNIRGAIENTVSISLFNKGLAGKIFSDVRTHGAKVVMKNNTPECVLISPDMYLDLIDQIQDAQLLSIATARMSSFDPSLLITQADIDAEFGFSSKDLLDAEGIEFE